MVKLNDKFEALHRSVYTLNYAAGSCSAKSPAQALRQWHRVHLMGAEIVSLAVNGQIQTECALVKLKAWIAGGGAWNCSAMGASDAACVIDGVLGDHVRPVVTGPVGGGRWGSLADLDSAIAKRNKGRQGEFWRGY